VAFVWLFAQQVGFLLYDGWFTRRRFWQLLGVIAIGYLGIWGLVSLGGYSRNMLSNQWPPTTPLAILAVVQAAALTVLHGPLTAHAHARRAGRGAPDRVTSHDGVPVASADDHGPDRRAAAAAGAHAGSGSPAWWWTRVPFLIIVLAAVWLLSLWLVRFEKAPAMGASPPAAGRRSRSWSSCCRSSSPPTAWICRSPCAP
jgi:hypothetical protein